MRDVFVSRPNALAEHQRNFWESLRTRLTERGVNPRTVGATDYASDAPVGKVKEVMSECHGVIILGLKQVRVIEGVSKEGTEKQTSLTECSFPTAWNHIEAGIAYALELPMLILKEPGINEGLFEKGTSEKYIHEATLPGNEWLNSQGFLQPLNSFLEDIVKHDADSQNSRLSQ